MQGHEMSVLLAVMSMAAVLFVFEVLSPDITSLVIMSVLLLTGLVDTREGLSGLANPATVTVAAFFVITRAIEKTGALTFVALRLARLARNSPRRLLAAIITMAATCASFLHATGVVAVFMPVVIDSASRQKESPSRYLIPLSYAAQFGGVCTLVGTTSNILVSAIMVEHRLPPIGMFEMTCLGVPLFCFGFAYLMLVGWHLIPPRRAVDELAHLYGLDEYVTEMGVLPGSPLVGKTLRDANLRHHTGVHVIEIQRGEQHVWTPDAGEVLQAGDLIIAKAALDNLMRASEKFRLEIHPDRAASDELHHRHTQLVEALVAPGSSAIGSTLTEVDFRARYGVAVLAAKHKRTVTVTHLRKLRLQANDTLLLQGSKEAIRRLQRDPDFVVLARVASRRVRRQQLALVLAIVIGVVAGSAVDWVPVVVGSLCGALVVVLTRILTSEEAYESVNWRVIFLMAGVVPLGLAVEKWGLAHEMAHLVQHGVGTNPVVLLSAVYFMTMVVTEFISHSACAALMTPIAFSTAHAFGLDPRPFCIAVAFATSTSFSTPVGYQTNAMIFGPGAYRFSDFPRVGIPLNLLFWLLSSWLIPIFWPLRP